MLSITACRKTISDRFPVASFVVHVPPHRVFEVACATDPQLFRGDHRGQRTHDNFFSSRAGGLLRAPAGQATYLLPPEQLRRFAGRRRLYFAVGAYGDAAGNAPEFTALPGDPAMPWLSLSPDFTGRTLDRSRLRRADAPADGRYGSPSQVALSWGGDRVALGSPEAAPAPAPRTPEYDDGYSPALWSRGQDASDPQDPPDPPDAALSARGEPTGYEDAPALRAQQEATEYGRRSYGGPAARAASAFRQPQQPFNVQSVPPPQLALPPEPPGLAEPPARTQDHADSSARAAYGRGAAGTASSEPPGLEEPPARAAYGRGAPASTSSEPAGAADPDELRGRGAAHFGGDSGTGLAEPSGDEHPHHQHPQQQRRFGDPSPAPSAAVSPHSLFPAAAGFKPPGVDDQYDDADDAGDEAEGELPAQGPLNDGSLTIFDKFRLVGPTARYESGDKSYAALNPDGEFNDSTHAAYQRKHYGLHWGLVQLNQRSGALGRCLVACERRDPARFREVFGPARDELLRVTTAATEEDRLRPVAGTPLWQEPWLARFAQAGTIPEFQAAQNEVAIERYFDPNLPFAAALGLDSDRALAMLYDRCINLGNAAGRRFVAQAVTPVKDDATLQRALSALGHDSVQAFQASAGLATSQRLGPKGHAALIAALRRLGGGSPVQVPTLEQMLHALVEASRGRRFERRVRELHDASDLSDVRRQVS